MHSVIHNCSAFHSTWFTHCENTWVTDSWCQATTTLLIAVCQHQFVPAVTSSETFQACFCLPIAISAQPLLACSSAEPCSIACAQLNARQWELVLSGEAGLGKLEKGGAAGPHDFCPLPRNKFVGEAWQPQPSKTLKRKTSDYSWFTVSDGWKQKQIGGQTER